MGWAVPMVRWGRDADTDWPANAEVELRLRADMPMVADTRFDELVVTRSDRTTPLGDVAPRPVEHALSILLERVAVA